MNDLETIVQTLGLAGAGLYAARYLAKRLETTQEKLVNLLETVLTRNTAILERVEKVLSRHE